MTVSALLDHRPPSPAPLRLLSHDAPAPSSATPPIPDGDDRRIPPGSAPRGFALYVGLDETTAATAGVSLATIVDALRATLRELVPQAESYAAVALAPAGAGGRDVDVVRRALHEPAAAAQRPAADEPDRAAARGVVVDISRKRVVIDGEPAALTFTEFELLQYLVLREGRTIDRAELVGSLWQQTDADSPGERTIDVHVRRLRSKLGRFEDIVRTVRGAGYRFDRHADVQVHFGHRGPSPDWV